MGLITGLADKTKGMISAVKDFADNPITKYGGGTSLSALAGLGVKQFQQRASDINQVKNYLHQNLGGPLSQAQRGGVQFGSKIPNELARQAYGSGSWWDYFTKRTSAHHLGPVEGAWKGGAKFLSRFSPAGVAMNTYELAKEGTKAYLDLTNTTGALEDVGSKIYESLHLPVTERQTDGAGDSRLKGISALRNTRLMAGQKQFEIRDEFGAGSTKHLAAIEKTREAQRALKKASR